MHMRMHAFTSASGASLSPAGLEVVRVGAHVRATRVPYPPARPGGKPAHWLFRLPPPSLPLLAPTRPTMTPTLSYARSNDNLDLGELPPSPSGYVNVVVSWFPHTGYLNLTYSLIASRMMP